MNKKFASFLKLIVTLAIISFILYKVGITNIIKTISNINVLWLTPVIIVYIITLILGALNIYILLSIKKKKIKYWTLFKYYILSYSLGLFTPSGLGEFYIAKLLKKHKIRISQGITISAIDKIITIFTMILITLIGAIFVFRKIVTPIIPLIILVLFIASIIVVLNKSTKKLLIKIFNKKKDGINSIYNLINKFIKNKKDLLLYNFIITVIKWIVTAIGIKIVFLSLGFNISFLLILIITMTARLISLIPITYDGLGIKESISIILFSLYNVPGAAVASMYLIYLLINYSLGIILILLLL